MPTLGAAGGCRLPDAILHGKRSCRPRSRAVQRFAVAGLLSEASKPGGTGGCATCPRTRPRHGRDACSASWPFAPGRPPLMAVRWPEATGLTSYLSSCLALTSQRCGLSHRQPCGSLHRTFACVRFLPATNAHFVPPLGVFGWAGVFQPARVVRAVLARSSNCAPGG
jgi:hypothetical protein